ncbi:flagellar hook-length control protein FliK [Flavonifractor sp. An306]|uniref:flagellar hook-length control protein FliK n=1 Tax=Flavonifractor sp. An306 TaxID=1965629 RepID=UPI0017481769|nr:flagellar hook-length control protein FliK [Flavonifractor sp. An306]
MNMMDMLLQAINQGAWALPNLNTPTTKPAGQESGPSFQDLLNERRDQLDQEPDRGQTQGTAQQRPVEEGTNPTQPEETQPQEPVLNADLMALGAALLAEGMPAQVQVPVTAEESAITVLPLENVQTAAVPVVTAEQEAVTAEAMPLVQQAAVQQPQEQTAQTAQQPVQEADAAPVQQAQVVTATPESQENSDAMESSQSFTAAPQQEGDTKAVEVNGSGETLVFQEVEHMPVKVGEKVEIDTTAPAADVDAKLSKALTQALDNGSQHVEITLSPANLGTVTAEFTRTPEGALHLVLRAENEHAAKLLSEHANTLGLMLQDSTRGEVRVEVPQPHQGQQPWQQPDQNGGQQQQQQQQQQRQVPKQEADSFLHQLRLGLLQSGPEAV